MHRGCFAYLSILLLNVDDLFKDDLMKLRRLFFAPKHTVLRLIKLRQGIKDGHVSFDLVDGSITTLH